MKICKYCQGEIPDDGVFCPKCGRQCAEDGDGQTIPTEEIAPAEETAPVEETAPAEETAPVEETAPAEETASAEESPSSEIKEGLKATPGKIALAVAAGVVLLAVLIALIVAGTSGKKMDAVPETTGEAQMETEATEAPATIPADGNPDDVTCKGSYTVSDEEAAANKDVVVATIGDMQLTNSQLQVYYWMEVQGFLNTYGAYASYFGLDYTQPLDTQLSLEGDNMTWQQYFLQCALNNWQQIQGMADMAQENGLEMNPEDRENLDNLRDSLEEDAAYYGMTLDELLLHNIGPGADFDDFAAYQEGYYQGAPYYADATDKMIPTEQELEAFFAAHEAEYSENGITKDGMFVNVRHILIGPEGGTTGEDGTTTYSDEEWAACEEEAQAVLDAWLGGEKTEESFAALANEKSQDGGSNTNGGLYENVYEGQMVQEFNDWCFDASRQTGDYGLVKTQFGYHVMYFGSSSPQWRYYAESDWKNEQINQMLIDLSENYPMEVDYSKITLGYVVLG